MAEDKHSSVKPYLIRAWYEWCCDNDLTPYIAVWVDENVHVPTEYVKNNEIVLNISPGACVGLTIDNHWVLFSARFAGISQDISIPVNNVLSIFARENGMGMGFEMEAAPVSSAPALHTVSDTDSDTSKNTHSTNADKAIDKTSPDDDPENGARRPNLRIIK